VNAAVAKAALNSSEPGISGFKISTGGSKVGACSLAISFGGHGESSLHSENDYVVDYLGMRARHALKLGEKHASPKTDRVRADLERWRNAFGLYPAPYGARVHRRFVAAKNATGGFRGYEIVVSSGHKQRTP